MVLNKCHQNLNFRNRQEPSLNDVHMNYMDGCIDILDDRVIELDSKCDEAVETVNSVVGVANFSVNFNTGNLEYTADSSIRFSVNSTTGNLEWEVQT